MNLGDDTWGRPMDESTLVTELHALGIDRYCAHMVALWPFVELAWTDTRVTDDRRARLLHLVRSRRALGRSGVRTLADWLSFKPSERYLARGHAVVSELIRRHDPESPPSDLISTCQAVALQAAAVLGQPPSPMPRDALLEVANLLFVPHEESYVAVAAQLDQTVITVSPFSSAELAALDQAEEAGLTPRGALRIAAMDAPAAVTWRDPDGSSQTLAVHGRLTIGRGPDNDVMLPHDVRVSRHHCCIERRGGSFFVADLGSANGTHVDGQFAVEAALSGGEVIRVGDTELTFLQPGA